MSDPKDTVASAEVVTPPTAPTAPAAKAETKAEGEPSWLNERLERERRTLLKKVGFESVEEAQASAAELKAKRESEKTASDKAAEATLRASAAESSTAALREAVSEFASRQMVGLTAEQKAAVTTIAGEDPALQLKAIAALTPTWAAAIAPAATTPAASAKAVDTAPAANAPAPITTSETNHKAQYESLRKSNPFAAAAYGLAHSADVFGNGT